MLELCRNGVKAVINLGLSDADYTVKEEERIFLDNDVAYIHIPVDFMNPEKKQLKLFFEYMKKHSHETTFVHCAANKRASCFLALWGEFYLGWSRGQAEEYVKEIWAINSAWSKFVKQMRSEFVISS
ncbi:hypothetical protein MNBD_GAMMA26-482 [hydrothermal vent metagenome]|uniref:DSP-PTPase phosphatase fused to NAD+ Kinase domain-containing protein n=1 Tax=hydrothermal vent metagenome TaxID=652676 RepID=A0A3B1B456_9ZZZZ